MDPFQELSSLTLEGYFGGGSLHLLLWIGWVQFSSVWFGSAWFGFELIGQQHHLVSIVLISHLVVCLARECIGFCGVLPQPVD